MKRDDESTAVLAYVAIIAVILGMIGGLLLARAWGDVYVQPGVEYRIQWTPGEGVTPDGYEIQRKVSSDTDYVRLGETVELQYVDHIGSAGDSASYRVRAFCTLLGGVCLFSEWSDESEQATAIGSVPTPCGIILTIGE